MEPGFLNEADRVYELTGSTDLYLKFAREYHALRDKVNDAGIIREGVVRLSAASGTYREALNEWKSAPPADRKYTMEELQTIIDREFEQVEQGVDPRSRSFFSPEEFDRWLVSSRQFLQECEPVYMRCREVIDRSSPQLPVPWKPGNTPGMGV